MEAATASESVASTNCPEEQNLCWSTWQTYFANQQHDEHNTGTIDGEDDHLVQESGLLQESRSPTTDYSPEELQWSPTATPTTETSTENGKLAKRKAQNRAAQRAHRERQRIKVDKLHEDISELKTRCKQLQARNRMFEDAFRRFLQDGALLFASKEESP